MSSQIIRGHVENLSAKGQDKFGLDSKNELIFIKNKLKANV